MNGRGRPSNGSDSVRGKTTRWRRVWEAAGGALLAVGLGSPGAGAAVAGTMIVASSMHVDKGFFNSKGGFEYPAVLGWSAAALALTGPGALSLDHVLGHRLNRSWMRNLALAATAPIALVRSSPDDAAW